MDCFCLTRVSLIENCGSSTIPKDGITEFLQPFKSLDHTLSLVQDLKLLRVCDSNLTKNL